MSRGESPPVLAINRCTSGHAGPAGRPSCWNRRRPSIPAAILSAHQPRRAAWWKKARRALALVATETRPQPCFPWLARNASTSAKETCSKARFWLGKQNRAFAHVSLAGVDVVLASQGKQ